MSMGAGADTDDDDMGTDDLEEDLILPSQQAPAQSPVDTDDEDSVGPGAAPVNEAFSMLEDDFLEADLLDDVDDLDMFTESDLFEDGIFTEELDDVDDIDLDDIIV
ncbi:MAG: hypothetical protein GXO10_03060 [Crenarchaeota archaeon]|nr:hypothetical protein [Thermoproteota archaeon]